MSFILKRIVISAVTLFLVSVLCFLAFSVIRGDPASYLAGIDSSAEQMSLLREEMGLNRNIFIRYFEWLFDFLSGNPGNSYSFRGESISLLISQSFPVTLTLASLSLALIVLIAFPLSLFTVKREGNFIDNTVNIFTAAGISTPGFFLGLLLIYFFGFGLKLFIPGVFISYNESFFGFLGCLFFPALAIAIPNAAILTKFLRGSLFAELKNNYIRTAKSKGLGSFCILRKHALKNAVLPSVSIMGMIIAEIFAGSVVIEQVFTLPGTGRLLIAAITSRDYPLIQALMVYIAFLVIAANTLADIVIMSIDPRIRVTRDYVK